MRGLLVVVAGCSPTIEAPAPAEHPPTVALDDVATPTGEDITLSPTTSDPDGDALTYAWVLHAAPPSSTVIVEIPTASLLTFMPDVAGSYVLGLTVSDGMHDVEVTAVVQARSGFDRPVAATGFDQMVILGTEVTLDGSASYDLDGHSLEFDWLLTDVPSGSTSALRSPLPVVPFHPDVIGSYGFELTVHNGNLSSQPQEHWVHVVIDDTDPGDVASGALLAEQVYAWGPVDECQWGLGHWSDLNTLVGRIDVCTAGEPRGIAMTGDGRVHYVSNGSVFELVCDDCPGWSPGSVPSADPQANDTLVPIDACKGDGTTSGIIFDLRAGPGDAMLVNCDGAWLDHEGRTVEPLGAYGTVLAYDGTLAVTSTGQVWDFSAGTATQAHTWYPRLAAMRATTGGFWAVFADDLYLYDPKADRLTFVQTYLGAPPSGWILRSAIDADGTLIQTVSDIIDDDTVIYRRRLDGLADEVWRFDDASWLIQVDAFLSGPQ